MHTGMLWFDNAPDRALKAKIQAAIDYYRSKFRHEPNLCLVNPAMMPDGNMQMGRLTVRAYGPVLPDHLWIGVEDQG